MSYNNFKDALAKEVERQAGEKYQVCLQTLKKNNGITRDAVSINKKGSKLTPLIHIDSFYDRYQKGESVIRLAAVLLQNYYEMEDTLSDLDVEYFSDYENVREHIYCKLVNIGMNKELLKDIPYRTYLDLAVVYYFMTDTVTRGDATILINKKHLEMWNLTNETLDRQAWTNTVADLTPSLCPIREIIEEYLGCASQEETEADQCGENQQDQQEDDAEEKRLPMYVLTNKKKSFGAICIRYPGMLEQLAEQLGGDFYILPSSVHECILVPADQTVNRDLLKEMVMDINYTQVEPQEILANQAYYYSRTLNKIMF